MCAHTLSAIEESRPSSTHVAVCESHAYALVAAERFQSRRSGSARVRNNTVIRLCGVRVLVVGVRMPHQMATAAAALGPPYRFCSVRVPFR